MVVILFHIHIFSYIYTSHDSTSCRVVASAGKPAGSIRNRPSTRSHVVSFSVLYSCHQRNKLLLTCRECFYSVPNIHGGNSGILQCQVTTLNLLMFVQTTAFKWLPLDASECSDEVSNLSRQVSYVVSLTMSRFCWHNCRHDIDKKKHYCYR